MKSLSTSLYFITLFFSFFLPSFCSFLLLLSFFLSCFLPCFIPALLSFSLFFVFPFLSLLYRQHIFIFIIVFIFIVFIFQLSESQFLDNLLIRVFSILQNSIIKFLNESRSVVEISQLGNDTQMLIAEAMTSIF